MKRRRLKNMLVATTALALLTTSIPMNLTVFAGSVGGGLVTGGGGATPVSDDSVNDDDLGLRFTLVTLENGERKVVQNIFGTYYFDLWGYSTWYEPDYNYINYTSRYDKEAKIENISHDYASNFDTAINNFVSTDLKGTSNIKFSSILVDCTDEK